LFFRISLSHILEDSRTCSADYSKLSELTANFKTHAEKCFDENTQQLVTSGDILDVVRPFCSDINVSTEVKSRVLHILEESIDLADDDVTLLLFYQSQAVIGPAWDLEVI